MFGFCIWNCPTTTKRIVTSPIFLSILKEDDYQSSLKFTKNTEKITNIPITNLKNDIRETSQILSTKIETNDINSLKTNFINTEISEKTTMFDFYTKTNQDKVPSQTSQNLPKLNNSLNKLNIDTWFQDDFEIEYLLDIMKNNIDLTNCLTNCSSNGKCRLNEYQSFVCECNDHYIGPRCQASSKPCASNPCLNGATCFNDFTNKTFKCQCMTKNDSLLFYGRNCEKKIDVCENETCSKNGICNDIDNEAKCKCFKSYSGIKCEIESQEIKLVKTVIKTSSIIAIIVICLTFFIFLSIDLLDFFLNRKNKKLKKRETVIILKYYS